MSGRGTGEKDISGGTSSRWGFARTLPRKARLARKADRLSEHGKMAFIRAGMVQNAWGKTGVKSG
jgi:hypothetical protein